MNTLFEGARLSAIHVAVIGAGSFGTALACVLATNGHQVTLLGRNADAMERLNRTHQNERYLPGVVIDSSIVATTDIKRVASADVLVIVVPSHAMRETCRQLRPYLSDTKIVVHATKGLEGGTCQRMSEVIQQEIDTLKITQLAVLSGPSHAEELSRRLPTTLVASSYSRTTAEFVQDVLMNDALRVYTNPDVVGTEIGGALKNIIALGCGISDGLSYGDNAKAALMTRGLVEIARLGLRLGADFNTFSGLSGIGDLIVTCTSHHSRNWNAGFLLGQGWPLEDALAKVGMVVEGVKTTPSALKLAAKCDVHLPIAEAIHRVLFEDKPPLEAVSDLMQRMRKHEVEEYVQETIAGWPYP